MTGYVLDAFSILVWIFDQEGANAVQQLLKQASAGAISAVKMDMRYRDRKPIRLAVAQHKPRTAYVVDILWRDVRRHKQHEALQLSAGAWNPADHPELAQGGAAYVEQIRSEPDDRFEDAIRQPGT